MYKVKIVVIGPCQSGKTVISNFLADATESSGGTYQPTQGVRILEFESGNISLGRRNVKTDVELWDCSGDFKFESCWPALAKNSNGVIFVYNPEQQNQDEDLEKFFDFFAQKQSLKSKQCLVLAYNKSGGTLRSVTRPPSAMSKLQTVTTNLDDDGEALRTTFNIYLKQILQILHDNQQEEEDSIVGT